MRVGQIDRAAEGGFSRHRECCHTTYKYDRYPYWVTKKKKLWRIVHWNRKIRTHIVEWQYIPHELERPSRTSHRLYHHMACISIVDVGVLQLSEKEFFCDAPKYITSNGVQSATINPLHRIVKKTSPIKTFLPWWKALEQNSNVWNNNVLLISSC